MTTWAWSLTSTRGSGGSGGPNILVFELKIEKSDIVPSYILKKQKFLEAFWSQLSLKNIQTLPVLRQKQIMRLLMKSWHDTRQMLFCDFEPGWSGGDSGTGWSGGDSGTRWTPVGDLNKRYRRLQDILLSSFDLLLLKSVTRNDRRVIKLKDLKKNQDSWLSGDRFNLSSVNLLHVIINI
jgi:hypothetical protein